VTAVQSGRRVWELHVAGRRVSRGVVLGPMVAGLPRVRTMAYGGTARAGATSHSSVALIRLSPVRLSLSQDFATKVH
jgi:hypothetical protein